MLEGGRQPGSHDGGVSDVELGIAKQEMRPKVQKQLDNLQAQVTRVLDRYSVSNFEELQALGEENPDNVSKKDIDRLLELAAKISKIVETGESGYDAEMFTGEYRRGVEGGISIGGRIVFRAKESFQKSYIVMEDGKILGDDDRFDSIGNPFDVSGQVGFIAKIGEEEIVVMEDGTEFGEGEGYGFIAGVKKIDGKIVFRALKNGKDVIVTEGGSDLGRGYAELGIPVDLNGSIAFSAERNRTGFIYVEGSGLIGFEKGYRYVSSPTMIGDNVAFVAMKGRMDQLVATENGRELHEGKGYRYNGLFDVVGKIVSRVNKRFPDEDRADWTQSKVFIVTEEGKEIGVDEDYRLVGAPKEIDGVIAFDAQDDDWKWSIVFEDGRKIVLDPEYKKVFGMEQVDENHISICAKTKTSYVREIVEIPEKV